LSEVEKGMSDKNSKAPGPAETPMSGRIDYEEVRKLIALLEEKNLSIFELETEGFKVKIGRSSPASPQAFVAAPAANGGAAASESPAAAEAARIEAAELAKGHHIIASPMVGTFYRAPDPTSAPFVDSGDTVKKGQTLCIIEAMKLMNEIEADVDGTVAEIYVENAKPVEFGQKLFAILPSS
jgi:acetyl-CoA carboxylase biotin carboxyl carrier protein